MKKFSLLIILCISSILSAADDFKSVAMIPGSTSDEIWTIVERTVDGNTVKYIEQFQALDWGSDSNDCWFVDSGTDDITDLAHLEGETVALWADGRPIGEYVVSGGEITPSGSYTYTTVGLPYTSVYETMPLVVYKKDGEAVNALETNIHYTIVDFYETLGCHIGVDASNLEDFIFSKNNFATTIDVVTDYREGPIYWGTKRSPTLYFTESDPVPLTIRSVMSLVEVEY